MILVATCSDYPHPTPSLAALLDALRSHGAEATHLPWDGSPPDDFANAEAVLPLCCWNYHDEPARFRAWIDTLETKGANLINSAATLRWNFRKTYLLEMAEAGLAVPRTFHLPEVDRDAVATRMEAEGWRVAILKPVSGQSGYGVRKIERADLPDLPAGEALLQEYQDDIGSLGETTLTFIDGAFSHAVRRVIRQGEWRANKQYGATLERVEVSDDVIEAARGYLALVPHTPLYARIDGLVRSRGFMLMELELIEPYLYLEYAPGSADAMARAVLQRLG